MHDPLLCTGSTLAARELIDVPIWGASSSVGQFAVQLAHRVGLRVIATASPRNFELVKSLGADLVFPYSGPHTPAKIFEATRGKPKHAVDCIGEGETPKQVSQAIGVDGGVVSSLLPAESPRKDIKSVWELGYLLFGKDIEIPISLPFGPNLYEFGSKAAEVLKDVLANGTLKPGPIQIMPKGLAGINDGFSYMQEG